ncbi:prolipoprotein diacylglyceryl transferase [Candidatus Gottesmanbacteria bacterium]|nr:prolipoprotein diacylglyceryl transferase [Candidatus Gottesmanbacteria bacterium]
MLPILFSIGPLHLYSLSFFLVLAWCVFSLVFWKALRREAVEEERIFDLMFWGTLVSAIVARVGFIVLHPELFARSILKMFALWVVPGLAFYPGLVAGVLTMVVLAKRKGLRAALVADALAFALPGALSIGAIGALLGGSVVGVTTKLPWAVGVVGYPGLRHPIGGYEAILLLLVLLVIGVLEIRAKRRDWPLGLLGIWFFLIISGGNFLLEFLVEHQLYWGLSANQWMLIIILGQAVGAFYVRGGGREGVKKIYGRIRRGTS